MSCVGCSCGSDKSKDNSKPSGCGSNGGCKTGGCNRLNTYDWLAGIDAPSTDDFDLVEVSFKNGSRKTFFHNHQKMDLYSHDWVVVESGSGYDVGQVSLQGELVKLQLRKKRVKKNTVFHNIIRLANERDIEKMHEARSLEKDTMIRARVIANMLDLKMKVGEVEYQADKRKATFFYTSEGRVDFRELIRHYAKEFKVKIEMRQIGARQESAKIGGLGACGRELCCSTWLSNFKSVSTSAARYQNLAINQTKLSGQCGRLKCCLNYELNTYMEVLKEFPKNAEVLKTEAGEVRLIKMDVFKRLMFYVYKNNKAAKGKVFALSVTRVREIKEKNKRGVKPAELKGLEVNDESDTRAESIGFADGTGEIELPAEKRRRRSKRNSNSSQRRKKPQNKNNPPKDGEQKNQRNNPSRNRKNTQNKGDKNESTANKNTPQKNPNEKPPQNKRSNNRRRNNRKRPPRKDGGNKNTDNNG